MPGNLGNAYGQIVLDGSPARKGVAEANSALDSLEKQSKKSGKNLKRAMAGLAAGFTAFVVSSVKQSAELEAGLDTIGSVMGATEAQTASLKQAITDLGLDPNLKVTAEEAATAVEMLGRNGLKVEEIIGGAAKATVLLANATGADFATAANIATDAMALWSISAKDMEVAVSGISSVVTNSKWSIDDYALGLAQAGGVAASVGVPFEEFGVVLAGIAPLFKSGSDAGTSFKTMLQRLEPQSDKARDKMMELGLITADGANQFFTASGALKSMEEISGILAGALSGLSDQQKLSALTTIFGTDAMRAAVGMAQMGADGYRDLADAMAETDAADMAARRMSNLSGSIEILGGVIETTQLKLGDFLSPAVNEAVKLLTEHLVDLNDQFDADKVERWGEALRQGLKWFLGGTEREIEGMIQSRIDASSSLEDYIALLQVLASMQGEIALMDVWKNDVMPDALAKIDRGLIQTSGSFDEYIAAVRRARDEMGLQIQVGNGSYEAFMLHYEATKKLIAEEEHLAKVQADSAQRAEQAARTRQLASGATGDLADSTRELTEAEKQAAAAQEELNARISAYFLDALGNLDKQASLGEMLMEQAKAIGLSAQATGELLTATGEMSQAEIDAAMARVEMAEITGELNALLKAGALTEEQVAEALREEWAARADVINAIYNQNLAEEQAEQQARETAEAEEELRKRLAELAQALDETTRGFTNQFMAATETGNATVNLGQELMTQAQAAGASATEMAALGLATGQLTEDQVLAALKTAILREKINELATAYANGGMSAQELVQAARDTRAELEEDFTATFNAEGIDGVMTQAEEFIGEMEDAVREEYGFKVEADTVAADTDLDTLQRRLEEMGAPLPDIVLDADTEAVQTALDEIPEAAGTATEDTATAVEEGMGEAVDAGADAARQLEEEVLASLEGMAAGAETSSGQLTDAVVSGVNDASLAAAGQASEFQGVGRSFATGLAAGVTSGGGILSGAVTTIVNNAVAAARIAAEIHSPSRVMVRIGEQMVAGLVQGLESGVELVEDAMTSLLSIAGIFSNVGFGAANAFRRTIEPRLKAEIEQLTDAIGVEQEQLALLLARRDASRFSDAGFLDEAHARAIADGNRELARQVETVWDTQALMARGADELARALDWDRSWVDDQSRLIEAYRDAQESGDQRTEAMLRSFMDMQEAHRSARAELADSLGLGEADVTDPATLARRYAEAMASGDIAVVRQIDAIIAAQDERNRAEAEYAEQLERINDLQEAQANLQFLQQQLDMLNMLAEHGLDAREILGDLELGAGADPLAIVEAMTATLDAVAGRVNEQIGSWMGYPIPASDAATFIGGRVPAALGSGPAVPPQSIIIYGGLHLDNVEDARSLFEELAGLGVGSSL